MVTDGHVSLETLLSPSSTILPLTYQPVIFVTSKEVRMMDNGLDRRGEGLHNLGK